MFNEIVDIVADWLVKEIGFAEALCIIVDVVENRFPIFKC